MNPTSSKRKHVVLKELGLLDKEAALENYDVLDEYHQLQHGRFVRWVTLDPTDIRLTNGAVAIKSEMRDYGLLVTVKSMNGKFYWSFKFNEVVLFQKRSFEETVVLEAMNLIL
jgi:hypothetical protein